MCPSMKGHAGLWRKTYHELECCADSHDIAMRSATELDIYALKKGRKI